MLLLLTLVMLRGENDDVKSGGASVSPGMGVDDLGPALILTSLAVCGSMSDEESLRSSSISSLVKDWCGACVTRITGALGEDSNLGGLVSLMLRFMAPSCLEGVLHPLLLDLSRPTELPTGMGDGSSSLTSAWPCLPVSMLLLDPELWRRWLWLWPWA